MVTLILIAILLTLLFGSAWLSGLVRNLALLASLVVAGILLEKIGVSIETAFYACLALLAVGGGAATFFLNKTEAEHKAKIKAARQKENARRTSDPESV